MSRKYLHNVIYVVRLGESYQIKYLSSVRSSSFDTDSDIALPLLAASKKNLNKLNNNISRALTVCREIALSNPWDYFVTLTLDPKKYNRFDLDTFHKDFSKFIKRLNRSYSIKIHYLVVPERHKNGSWHMHGLFYGLPDFLLSSNSNGFLDFPLYSQHFGFCSISPVRDSIAVSLYITKHLGKQIHNGVVDVGQHLYYRSRGLSRGVLVSVLREVDLPPDFNFQYVSSDGLYKSSFFEDGSFLSSLGLI